MGLFPVVVQHAGTGVVLMVGFGNEESMRATEETGFVHFWSRSRGALWKKGETSGNTLRVAEIALDCDEDAVLIRAQPAGPTCHTGAESCFGEVGRSGFGALATLDATIASRAASRPAGSYTAALIAGGVDACARKVVEEAAEVAFAAKDHAAGSGEEAAVADEAADLIYHLLVLLAERGISTSAVLDVLTARAG
jgi:phosphoribosyl-AMP cyclohydrolase / phosphoribosyl-ATP pyrophosphohydrolase